MPLAASANLESEDLRGLDHRGIVHREGTDGADSERAGATVEERHVDPERFVAGLTCPR
jgi:hypothetical protein